MGINFDNFHAVRAQSAFGAVLLLSGGVTPRDSVLMCKKDVLYLDDATKQPVHPFQKSLSLFSQLLKVYTSEWVCLIRHFYDIMRMLGICCHGEVM